MTNSIEIAAMPANVVRTRVLVVDDEPAILRAMSRRLRTSGHEVVTAGDGQEAIDLMAASSFDAVVSDIDMPHVDGIRLLEAVHRGDPGMPFILMTGVPAVETAMAAVAHGALLYLSKPVGLEEVDCAVRRAIDLGHAIRERQAALEREDAAGPGGAEQLALASSFERVLDSLWMAYQPIVSARDRTLFGHEALLRSADKSLPHPGAILDAAERLGRLHDLGRRIRARTAADASGVQGSTFFVNLHASDLMDDTLLSATSPLAQVADRIVLEITERASLDGVTDARAKVAELRRMGFRIAIDDLGAGYAGLTSFATLEPEFVKLDMSLIRDVDKNATKEKLIGSMTSLCRDLGMVVVAEGVETIAERDALVALGCDLLQGYLLGRPGPGFPTFSW